MTELSGADVRRAFTGRRIGTHLPLAMGLLKAADRAVEIGATAAQVFTDNPTAWRRRSEPPAKLADFRARLAEHAISPVAVHGPYLVNLAGSDELFWRRSIETLVTDLDAGAGYGARFLNIHVGSHRGLGRDAGIARVASGVAQVMARVPPATPDANLSPMLVLENSAGTGDGIGSTLEDLHDIVEALAAAGVDMARIGICLDTAHLWAAGYELDSPEGVDAVALRAERLLGRDRVVMVHLNDARAARGARVDRHEHIGAGRIGAAGLRHVLQHEWLGHLPTYLETPGMDVGYDAVNLQRVALLLRGEELPALPPEAFTLRGARSRTAPGSASGSTARAG